MIVGIDPGLTGAIAIIANENVSLFDMPVYKKNGKNWINIKQFINIMKRVQKGAMVIIEDVHSMPGNKPSSMFKFGRGFGIILGVCTALGLEMEFVSPRVWKGALGLTSKKAESVLMANSLYGKGIRKSKDGQAEALLIAHYWINKDKEIT